MIICYDFRSSTDRKCPRESNKDVQLVETRTVHFAPLLNRSRFEINAETRKLLLVLANFVTCLPPERPCDIIVFLPSVLKGVHTDSGYRE